MSESETGWVDPTKPHPRCDAMAASIDSNDARAWQTLAEKMELKARFFQNENHMRSGVLQRIYKAVGYNNDDGHHATPGPEELLAKIIAEHAAAVMSFSEERTRREQMRAWALWKLKRAEEILQEEFPEVEATSPTDMSLCAAFDAVEDTMAALRADELGLTPKYDEVPK